MKEFYFRTKEQVLEMWNALDKNDRPAVERFKACCTKDQLKYIGIICL